MDRKMIDYYPVVLKDLQELRQVTDTEQVEVEQLWDDLDEALQNQFIQTTTAYGVTRWENILRLHPKADTSLEERKFSILSKLSEELPYTWKMLKKKLVLLCGEKNVRLELYHEDYFIKVRIALAAKNSLQEVESLLRSILPANLLLDLSLLYNTHKQLQPSTYQMLKEKTHNQIRNEVIM